MRVDPRYQLVINHKLCLARSARDPHLWPIWGSRAHCPTAWGIQPPKWVGDSCESTFGKTWTCFELFLWSKTSQKTLIVTVKGPFMSVISALQIKGGSHWWPFAAGKSESKVFQSLFVLSFHVEFVSERALPCFTIHRWFLNFRTRTLKIIDYILSMAHVLGVSNSWWWWWWWRRRRPPRWRWRWRWRRPYWCSRQS